MVDNDSQENKAGVTEIRSRGKNISPYKNSLENVA